MSNLSELLPAGSGAKVAEFVASGTLANGQAVVLKTDGTVAAISATGGGEGIGTPVVLAADSPYVTSTFDSNSNKVVVTYRDGGNSNYGTAAVGTVSGTSISFGTPAVFYNKSINSRSVTFDSTNNKIVIGFYYYTGSANIGTAVVGTVSGTSISFGSAVSIAGSSIPTYLSLVYDANAQRVVASYRDANNSDYGTAVVGTVSGTSISFGSPVIFLSKNIPFIASTFDSNANKVVVAYQDYTNASYGTAIVGTVSGTSISFGSPAVFESATVEDIKLCFDTTANKSLIAYSKSGAYLGTAVVGTVSGTSISFGSPAAFHAASTYQIGLAYDSNANKTVITYANQASSNIGTLVNATISGTSVSFSSVFVFNDANTSYTAPVYDSNAKKPVIAYADNGNSGYATSVVYSATSSNNTDFVGITNAAISNSATGEVAVQGGLITNASLLPSVASSTFGTDVAFQSGEMIYPSICYDTANDKIVIAYMHNASGAPYGKAIVGTVSGTSISFGSAVTFNAATTNRMSIAFDASASKVVISYINSGNSSYGTAIVGTVSGTNISFGSPVVFESANTGSPTISYDANASKNLIAYQDGGNSNYLTGIVGTVSGTSISFGTAVALRNTAVTALALAYDSTAQKHALVYVNGGASNRGDAGVVSISGTTPSVGTFTDGLTASMQKPAATYDSSSGKVVVAYQDNSNSDYATAAVGTISGTSITFGTAVVVNAASSPAIGVAYDAASNATFVLYKDGGNSSYGTAKGGIVSGTSISFGSASVFLTANPGADIATTIDSDNNKLVAAYVDYGNSQNGTAVVGTLTSGVPALSIGTDYFVQTDGTLSTTTSAVPAGRALSTTSILLEG